VDQQVPEYLDDEDWQLYRDPTTGKLRLRCLQITFANLAKAYVNYTARHVVSEGAGTSISDTVPVADREAVVWLAASLCFLHLAAYYATLTNPSLQADRAFGEAQSTSYVGLAREAFQQYERALGLEAAIGAAGALRDLDVDLFGPMLGIDRFFHARRTR
jgi:hypothetical protein